MQKKMIGAIALLFVAVIACYGAGRSEDSQAQSSKMVVWAWDQNLPSINFAAEKYKENHPDSQVEIVVQNVPDTVTKISTFLASGVGTDLPDMVLMDNNQIQSFLRQFPGKFVNLSERGYDKHKASFSAAHWDILSTKGSLYAFPFDIAPLMIAVNTEITDAAGVDPTGFETWEDVLAAAQAIQAAGYSVHVPFKNREVFGMMQSSGVGIFDAEGNIDLLNPKLEKVIDLYLKLAAGKVSDESAMEDGFVDGTVAMNMKPAWAIGEDMPGQPSLDGKVILIPLPKVEAASGYTSSANDGGSSFFILETSKAKDVAYEIGEIITTNMESQEIALAQGLMPGYLPAASLDALNAEISYYQGQKIWKMLSESAADTPPVNVPIEFQTGKDVFQNTVIDVVRGGTTKSAAELLRDAAEMLASQTGLSINKY